MEEIKVGDYVRLARNQGINRIEEIDVDGDYILDKFIADKWGDEVCCISRDNLDDEIIKHSSDIIDLIEVGDYVNGHLVIAVDRVRLEISIENADYGCGYEEINANTDIKSIITKEQYEAIKYVIGE